MSVRAQEALKVSMSKMEKRKKGVSSVQQEEVFKRIIKDINNCSGNCHRAGCVNQSILQEDSCDSLKIVGKDRPAAKMGAAYNTDVEASRQL